MKKIIHLIKTKKTFKLNFFALFLVGFLTVLTYLFLSRKTTHLDITLRLYNQDIPEYSLGSNAPYVWYTEKIIPGKAIKNLLGESTIEIVDTFSYPTSYVSNEIYVTLRVKAIQNKVTKQYTYEGSPLLINDLRSFKIQDLLLNGVIVDLSSQQYETKKFKILVELSNKNYTFQNNSDVMVKGIENYVADLVKENMSIKDSRNNEITKILEVTKKPGVKTVTSNTGIRTFQDPERTQIFLTVEILAEKIGNSYFYKKTTPILTGEEIWFNLDDITVVGIILSVLPE